MSLSPRSRPLLGRVPGWVHGWALGAFVVVILVLVYLTIAYRGQNVWANWVEARELRRPAYPETIHVNEVFRTCSNTWSNLAYVLVGFYALALARWDRRRELPADSGYLVRTPPMSVLFAVACCGLGAGSGLFHASLTRLGQQLDVAAMYPPLMMVIAISLGRRWPRLGQTGAVAGVPSWPVFGTIVAVVGWVLFTYKWSMSSLMVLSTLILAVLFVSGLDSARAGKSLDRRWLMLAPVTLVAGIVCRQLDVAHRFSHPDSWCQGHALWHVLTAASLGCMYAFYRSEQVLSEGEGG